MWRNLTIYVAFPVIILAHINAFLPHAAGHEVKHRPDFVAYEYLRIRTKVETIEFFSRCWFVSPSNYKLITITLY